MQKTEDSSSNSERCIAVVDEAGNRYEATWKRRAQGLVKNGRARYIDESTICLTCPPKKITKNSEEHKMTTQNTTSNIEEITPIGTTENEALSETEREEIISEIIQNETISSPAKYSIEYALEQIQKIQEDGRDLTAIINKIAFSSDTKVDAIRHIITVRETTNQKLINFYQKMIDDLNRSKINPQREAERSEFLNFTLECVKASKSGAIMPDFEKIWDSMNK